MFDKLSFINFNEFILVLQNNSSHSILIRVKCENQQKFIFTFYYMIIKTFSVLSEILLKN